MQHFDQKISGTSDAPINTGTKEKDALVVARIAQGAEARINIRLVQGREILIKPELLRCQPRQGASRRETEPVSLRDDLIVKLRDANKNVIAWLAKEEANAEFFLAEPVQALLKAGVELTRTEQKALQRQHNLVSEVSMVPPGVDITHLSAKAFSKGSIGKINPRRKKSPESNDDCACGSEEKE